MSVYLTVALCLCFSLAASVSLLCPLHLYLCPSLSFSFYTHSILSFLFVRPYIFVPPPSGPLSLSPSFSLFLSAACVYLSVLLSYLPLVTSIRCPIKRKWTFRGCHCACSQRSISVCSDKWRRLSARALNALTRLH